MSIHINYSNAIKMLVSEVIRNSRPLDKVLESFFRNQGIPSGEKEDMYHLFTFVIRYWITIHELYRKQFEAGGIDFHEILHIQQILYRHLTGKLVCRGRYETLVKENIRHIEPVRHLRESYPGWLDSFLNEQLPGEWDKLAQALNQSPLVFLRANTLMGSSSELIVKLLSQGYLVSEVNGAPDAVQVRKYFDLFRSCEFQAGLFEMQDAGSQRIAPFLKAEPGMRVVDACAGTGGKTLHLAALMQNKGKIIAMDNAGHKLETLRKRAKRAGAFNIETRAIDSSKTIKRLHNTADRLLLDVPCSGTGVIRRNPDIKYHLSHSGIQDLIRVQEEILEKYAPMLSANGLMVYSTCSILPAENRQQIDRFLKKSDGRFILEEDQTISPLEGTDGFYMARLRRIV